MSALRLKIQDSKAIIIRRGHTPFIFCPNCRDYTLHRKIEEYTEYFIYACHICGNRIKLKRV